MSSKNYIQMFFQNIKHILSKIGPFENSSTLTINHFSLGTQNIVILEHIFSCVKMIGFDLSLGPFNRLSDKTRFYGNLFISINEIHQLGNFFSTKNTH